MHTILKQGSCICIGSNIYQVVQQNQWNKPLSPFKCQVQKFLNIINAKMVSCTEKIKCILHVSLDMQPKMHPPLVIATADGLKYICHVHWYPSVWCNCSIKSMKESIQIYNLSITSKQQQWHNCWPLWDCWFSKYAWLQKYSKWCNYNTFKNIANYGPQSITL